MKKIQQIVESFYTLYKKGRQSKYPAPSSFIDYFKARDFLTQALTTQQEEFKKMVEGMKRVVLICDKRNIEEYCHSCSNGLSECDYAVQDREYNQALDDLLTKLNQE